MERIDDESLKTLLSEEIRAAIQYDKTELADKRAQAMEYYRGEMNDTPPVPNRSKFVSRDVADTIGWMLPGIIRVFTASDRMAEFEPEREGDEEAAKQATDYINFVFHKDNPGYRNLWDATHDSLLLANGIIKHWWDDKEECEYSEHSGMTAEQIAIFQQEQGVEIVAQKKGEPQTVLVPGPEGEMIPQEVETFEIKVKRVVRSGRVRIESIPPEDFFLDREATCIEEARFCAHRELVTRSDLVEMGFDKAIVSELHADYEWNLTEEKLARDEEFQSYNDVGHESMRQVELFECYVRADVDGDGVAETIRAYYAGNSGAGELLDWEVWDDDVPFSDIPCEPVPHRWEARSVADETMDVQRIKTVLTRQMLDNLYASNLPQREAELGAVVNPESLVNPKFGQTIWRKPGSQPTVPHVIPFVADKVLVALEHFDSVTEKRTGVSRTMMALDPEALQNQSATANQNARDASYSQVELIARNMAELGWRRVFRQLLRLVVKHQDRPRVIRLRDEWVEIDPRHWNANMDVTINVGLGTGSRDRDMSMLTMIGGSQMALAERLMAAGFGEEALDMLPKIVKTMVNTAEAAGIRNPQAYYPQFGEDEIVALKEKAAAKASQPDPKMQIEMQKLEADKAKGEMQIQLDQQKAASQIQLEQVKGQQEIELKREQLAAEMALKREQLAAELQLKRELSMAEMQMKREVGFYSADTKAATSKVHMGGDPG